MQPSNHLWAIILAAREGSRLRAWTTGKTGQAVPKQFCTLRGGPTLLDEAMQRANSVAAAERICPFVAEQHANWWQPLVTRLPPGNLIVQPANRGTAIGILYAVMYVLARDPQAYVVLIPADHFVRDDEKLQDALLTAIRCGQHDPSASVLIGLEPEDADPQLAYIVPGEGELHGSNRVKQFVSTPTRKTAEELIQQGGLWNTCIIAACGRTLVDTFFAKRFSLIVAQIDRFLGRITADGRSTRVAWSDLVSIYQRFPVVDFSHDILAGRESELRVVRAGACGWTDLGTPIRVAEALQRLHGEHGAEAPDAHRCGPVNVAAQHAHFESGRR